MTLISVQLTCWPHKDNNGTHINLYKGAAYEKAEADGEDLSFLDGTFVDCEADDYQGHGVELEVYRFDYESRYWMGPFYYWSDLYQTGSSSDLKARNQIIMQSIYINYYTTFLKKVDKIF